MPRPRLTEDIEFRTDIDSGGNVVRRGRFVTRPRRVGGRSVPGNARYYRRRQRELLAGQPAARRAVDGARRGRQVAARAGRNAGNPRPARAVTPRAPRRAGGVRGAVARASRGLANRLERRRRSRG